MSMVWDCVRDMWGLFVSKIIEMEIDENKRAITKRDCGHNAPARDKAVVNTYGIPREVRLTKAVQYSAASVTITLLDMAARRRATARASLQTANVIIH